MWLLIIHRSNPRNVVISRAIWPSRVQFYYWYLEQQQQNGTIPRSFCHHNTHKIYSNNTVVEREQTNSMDLGLVRISRNSREVEVHSPWSHPEAEIRIPLFPSMYFLILKNPTRPIIFCWHNSFDNNWIYCRQCIDFSSWYVVDLQCIFDMRISYQEWTILFSVN